MLVTRSKLKSDFYPPWMMHVSGRVGFGWVTIFVGPVPKFGPTCNSNLARKRREPTTTGLKPDTFSLFVSREMELCDTTTELIIAAFVQQTSAMNFYEYYRSYTA